MRIAIVGGTGDFGQGIAVRLGAHTDHELTIGSRTAEKAVDAAAAYCEIIDYRSTESISGASNDRAVSTAEIAILAVPPFHIRDTVRGLSEQLKETTLVTPAVGLAKDETGFHYRPPDEGSVTELVADVAPDETPVVGAFHNLPAGKLADLETDLDVDTLVVGNDPDARGRVASLAEEIEGITAYEAGPITNASEIEGITPLLINLARYNEQLQDVGARFC
ncbi:NADPH-dependent F420 reductase (plasmid) [Haloferax mediterranei ATCC 33500]|uniref:F420-dependent NADP reductase n=1 Tax=Haloferax mediterranei (strain ATCC 33500 / DSM 1411 / JCM 8866 / NBRC 14739 / NCIMB 2177 / R-4) TaxID=523841 RepID=I3RAB0_HALMT|nr:NADPH-dependent F420 reductase [Haloferax mediterranei]AFK21170.1 F420-dependent NADP reductase [Haloferax mediterranei ATCC 33500]AHZ24711.1 NADPH-dependent F420 reductase [Haloferax mediterranei ATCC 33500]ELZ97494.1 NADPH-dependent F420 reductase [Haloferax mediterranei ATCC 33500]MDX5990214.1 NADPH-dependent F420 reductase [Haloferax mediterranei ATCC 33500]QCQ76717.1 NADPH-dependent F420 reductase [Haloferax mediterranei ATCC 33500]